jgi:DNA-binding IclR family transcriptional regulator
MPEPAPTGQVAGRSGTQTLERAAALMRAVASLGHAGASLSELAKRCQLSKSTAHRILMGLARERLIQQRADRHYVPGPMLFELGLSALPERRELQHAARGRLAALARETNGVAFLTFRSGDDGVCAVRVGSARLDAKALAIFPGARRPLVTTAGGVAILAATPKDEAWAAVRRNLEALRYYPDVAPAAIVEMMRRAFAEGYAINAGYVFPGLNGFGLALRDSAGVPFAAISVGGPARSFPAERADDYRRLLAAAADELQGARSGGA